MVFVGRPVRSANSAWDMPRDSRTSSNVSPGGLTLSGAYWFLITSVMSVHHLFNQNCCDLFPIKAKVRFQRNRVMSRVQNQAIRAVQIERNLKIAVSFQFVAAARKISHRLQIRSSTEVV